MKKFKYIILLLLAAFAYYKYNSAQKYDANNPKASLDMMIKLTNPFGRQSFIHDFYLACNDQRRCINLHGLKRNQIHDIAISQK